MQVAVVVTQHGGPEVLELQPQPIPDTPRDGVLIKQHCAGVNFIDTCVTLCR
jgi:NADPH2:quinone reductase